MISHSTEQLWGIIGLLILGVWGLYEWAGWRVQRHVDRATAYMQSCADAFDKHCDDSLALFPPAPADELAARRVRGDTR